MQLTQLNETIVTCWVVLVLHYMLYLLKIFFEEFLLLSESSRYFMQHSGTFLEQGSVQLVTCNATPPLSLQLHRKKMRAAMLPRHL